MEQVNAKRGHAAGGSQPCSFHFRILRIVCNAGLKALKNTGYLDSSSFLFGFRGRLAHVQAIARSLSGMVEKRCAGRYGCG